MMRPKVILHGGGGHAKVVIDALKAMNADISAVFDPKFPDGDLMGIPFKGAYDPAYLPGARIVLSIGSNQQRKLASARAAHAFYSAVHPSSIISLSARIGEGSMILQGTIIQADAVIGRHVIVNTAASVDHDCVIGDFVHIAPKASLCGNVTVGEGTLIGAGAIVLPGVKIGQWAVVGAGAVVRKDVPDLTTVVGNPAKGIRTKTK